MPDIDDIELLRSFAATRNEASFAELVRRHIGLVYSTALRRTGNPHSAEEIAQAVFVLLARKASRLPDRTILSGWLYQTARLTASNYHRAEARRQKREQEAYVNSLSNEPEKEAWEQIAPLLDEAMATLSQSDHHAIVLRYFENKSLEEVGAALKMSGDAARMRVNRAIEKLRGIFSRRGVTLGASMIAGSLSTYAVEAAPAGLAIAVASSAAKTVGASLSLGLGAKLISALGKSTLLSWMAPLLALFGALPGLLFTGFMGRMERKNYRDADGFRSRLHGSFFKSFFWGYPLLLLAVLVISSSINSLWGESGRNFILLGFVVFMLLLAARSLVINRNPFQITMFAQGLIIAAGLAGDALAWLPQRSFPLSLIIATGLLLVVWGKPPIRMDYSLLLRAAQGLLPNSTSRGDLPPDRLRRSFLMDFARFLGFRYLVINFQWDTDGLILRLPPARTRFLTNIGLAFMLPISRRCSWIRLGWDGTVASHCGPRDWSDLVETKKAWQGGVQELETAVAESVRLAWLEFRSGRLDTAERFLGHLPESEVFVVSPARSKATRWWRYGIGIWIILMLLLMGIGYWQPPWLEGLHPVSVTETQVRDFLNNTAPNPNPSKLRKNSATSALFSCLVLPSTNLFNREGLRQMRDEVIGREGYEAARSRGWKPAGVFGTPLLRRALAGGWLNWADLDLLPENTDFHSNLTRFLPNEHWDHLMTRCQAWSWVQGDGFPAIRIKEDGLAQLRLLSSAGCLDLIGQEEILQQIISAQVLSPTPPGQPPLHHWRNVRGLFFTPCYPVLQDTYFSLAALEILGGLDRIDREQCIRGILRQHRGKGYFTSPSPGGFNEYHIRGDARDTFAAFESLRILGALDRVKDLQKWQFRPYRRGVPKGELTWHDVEAWVCQQRLQRNLQERRTNPSARIRSLLEP